MYARVCVWEVVEPLLFSQFLYMVFEYLPDVYAPRTPHDSLTHKPPEAPYKKNRTPSGIPGGERRQRIKRRHTLDPGHVPSLVSTTTTYVVIGWTPTDRAHGSRANTREKTTLTEDSGGRWSRLRRGRDIQRL